MKGGFSIFSQELKKLISYRSDFWINFVGQTFFSIIVAYSLWSAIFASNQVNEMGGYTLQGMLIYYLFAPLIFRLTQGENIGNLARDIYDGGLSKYLLYPISFFQYKTMTYLAYSAFYYFQLILFFIVCKFFLDTAEMKLEWFNLIQAIPFLLLSSLSYFAMSAMVELVAFWADNIWSLNVLLRFCLGLFGGTMIPLSFFPEQVLSFIQYLPFPYLVNTPLQIILGKLNAMDAIPHFGILLCWYFVFMGISRYIWKRGQYAYTGVGM